MTHVFISYVRDNSEEVQRLCQVLSEHGITVWLDRDSIYPGYRWKDAIRKAIRTGDFFIACFSREYTERSKTYMNEELILAIEELRQRPTDRAWFIPVLLSDVEIPDREIGGGETLRSIQWISLYESWDRGIQRLLSVFQPSSLVVQEIVKGLDTPSEDVRRKAIYKLRNLGKPVAETVPYLFKAFRDDQSEVIRVLAGDALLAMGKTAIPFLLEHLLDDFNYRVDPSIGDLLVRMGEVAIFPLLELCRMDNFMSRWPSFALGYARDAHKSIVSFRSSISDLLAKFGSGAIPILIQGMKEYYAFYRTHSDDWIDRMNQDAWLIKAALSRMGKVAIPVLSEFLKQEEDENIQKSINEIIREIELIDDIKKDIESKTIVSGSREIFFPNGLPTELKKLKELKDSGIITEEDFEARKNKICEKY